MEEQDRLEKNSDRTYGMVGTIIFHGVLLLLFLIWGLTTIVQEEEGILVALGDSQVGMGTSAPPRTAPTPQPAASQATPPPPASPPVASTPQPSREQVMTQNVDPAPAVSPEEKARREARERERLEEQRRLEEQERQRRIEQERQRQEQLERQRREEEERRRREEQERQAQAARDAASRAFSGTGGSDQSQGDTEGSGTQGHLSGDPSASGTTGTGLGQSGSSFSLSGRSLSGALPRPEYNIQEEGIVVVEITVDRTGVVTNAQPILRGTTTQNSYLWRVAREAALKARFNRDPNAPAFQTGTISYHFILN
ncbi:energy transducer TonB family protein [Alkalitalea saponilacus]|uniref:TonB family C-terminal domain-containing protein n=1 Tax=Alkalitalea saponilacus TaxID=889453 RepID=A0A1T5HU46_9BACT|nr:energy transducer TonB [Alkalitalea saponilacus]ASB49951.1 hypothetical protein CDL62_12780 [Alkalitalea saponilacus]SKC24020.1 hypothetical protein SAMN03080601_03310 [Alkalitalea saponilacus]